MDVQQLKQYIHENNFVQQILESTGCHHIKFNGKYWTCANHDGDNHSAITVYNTDFLNVVNYTRNITQNGKLPSDLITLVCYNKSLSFFEAIKFICSELGLSYYHDFEQDVPESLKITKMIFQMQENGINLEDDKVVKPINEKVLSYYKPYVNNLFLSDNIDYNTQKEFEIGYDDESNRITIPIRSEIGDLVGVKGRLFKKDLKENELKYLYLEPCSKGRILYGIHKTYEYIVKNGFVYVGEAEKFVLQCWSMGYYNAISVGGKTITKHQVDKITRLGVDVVLCFDKDVTKKELQDIANSFIEGIKIYCIVDDKNILNQKESPTDNKEKWERLLNDCVYRIN